MPKARKISKSSKVVRLLDAGQWPNYNPPQNDAPCVLPSRHVRYEGIGAPSSMLNPHPSLPGFVNNTQVKTLTATHQGEGKTWKKTALIKSCRVSWEQTKMQLVSPLHSQRGCCSCLGRLHTCACVWWSWTSKLQQAAGMFQMTRIQRNHWNDTCTSSQRPIQLQAPQPSTQ